MTNLEIFTHNIMWLRRHYGLSKKRMADMLKIGLWSLNKIEKGEVPPRLTIEVLFVVQKCFGISPTSLLQKPFADGEELRLRRYIKELN